jgi:hypothetical protein
MKSIIESWEIRHLLDLSKILDAIACGSARR